LHNEYAIKHKEITVCIQTAQQKLDNAQQLHNDVQDQIKSAQEVLNGLHKQREELTSEIRSLKTTRKSLSSEDATQKREQLYTYLHDNPYARVTDIASAIGVSRNTAGAYLRSLIEDNVVEKHGNGQYVTTNGRTL
jgi:Fic family protein